MDINSYNEIWIYVLNIIGHLNIVVKSALLQLFCPTLVYVCMRACMLVASTVV